MLKQWRTCFLRTCIDIIKCHVSKKKSFQSCSDTYLDFSEFFHKTPNSIKVKHIHDLEVNHWEFSTRYIRPCYERCITSSKWCASWIWLIVSSFDTVRQCYEPLVRTWAFYPQISSPSYLRPRRRTSVADTAPNQHIGNAWNKRHCLQFTRCWDLVSYWK